MSTTTLRPHNIPNGPTTPPVRPISVLPEDKRRLLHMACLMSSNRVREAERVWRDYQPVSYRPEAGVMTLKSPHGTTSTVNVKTRFCSCEDAKTCRRKNRDMVAEGFEEFGAGEGVECKHCGIADAWIASGELDTSTTRGGFANIAEFERKRAADFD